MNLENIRFKVRFLKFYILFGIFGLTVEFIVRYFVLLIFSNDFFATIFGVICGVLFAYWSNIKFNFQIPSYRLKRALILFTLIAILSKFLQSLLSSAIGIDEFGYELQRLLTSSLIFIVFYFINVQFTFANRTQLGIAIYANNNEDLENIYSKVLDSPDFIQVDLVDKTVYENALEVNISKINSIREQWPEKFIEIHLMTNDLLAWEIDIQNILPLVDMIIFNKHSYENNLQVIKKLKSKKPSLETGVYLDSSTNTETIKKYTNICDQITIMGIENIGYSGQKFLESTIETIKKIDKFENRNKFKLEVDGGIDSTNYHKLRVDKLVSASSVLNSENSIKKVLEFKKL